MSSHKSDHPPGGFLPLSQPVGPISRPVGPGVLSVNRPVGSGVTPCQPLSLWSASGSLAGVISVVGQSRQRSFPAGQVTPAAGHHSGQTATSGVLPTGQVVQSGVLPIGQAAPSGALPTGLTVPLRAGAPPQWLPGLLPNQTVQWRSSVDQGINSGVLQLSQPVMSGVLPVGQSVRPGVLQLNQSVNTNILPANQTIRPGASPNTTF